MSLLGLRRPLFALFLAAGSPAVSPIRAFDYRIPIESLKGGEKHVKMLTLDKTGQRLVVFAEWVLALAAIINVMQLGTQLGFMTVSTFASVDTWTVVFWSVLAVVIHIAGNVSLRLMVRVEPNTRSPKRHGLFLSWLLDELTPSANLEQMTLYLRQESYWFLFMSWATATGTVLHTIYGTLILSSLIGISVQDTLLVVARYFISALVCRALVMFELSGMRKPVTVKEQDTVILTSDEGHSMVNLLPAAKGSALASSVDLQ